MGLTRVTERTISQLTLDGLQNNLSRLQRVQEKMSTGKELSRPSDNPTDAVSALTFRADVRRFEQYSRNAQDGQDWLGEADNTLVDYLASLDKVGAYEADEVLPAHEHRFVGLQIRVKELKQHHEERFGEVVQAIKAGADTAWEITARMHWSRPWDRINGWMRRAALGEALAHIRVLETRGVVRMVDGMPVRWEVVQAG